MSNDIGDVNQDSILPSELTETSETILRNGGAVVVDYNALSDGVKLEIGIPGFSKPAMLFVNYQTAKMLLLSPRGTSLIHKAI